MPRLASIATFSLTVVFCLNALVASQQNHPDWTPPARQWIAYENERLMSIGRILGIIPEYAAVPNYQKPNLVTAQIPQMLEVFGLDAALIDQLKAEPTMVLNSGNVRYRWSQQLHGIPFVEGRLQIIVSPDGEIVSAGCTMRDLRPILTRTRIGREQAVAASITHTPTIPAYRYANGSSSLEVRKLLGSDTPDVFWRIVPAGVKVEILINAEDIEKIFVLPLFDSLSYDVAANAFGWFPGDGSPLHDMTNWAEIVDHFVLNGISRGSGDPDTGNSSVDACADAIERAIMHYSSALSHNSWANSSVRAIVSCSGVDNNVVPSLDYSTFAGYFRDIPTLVFGRGKAGVRGDLALDSDIVVHEYSHGVVDSIGPLNSLGASGNYESEAINESFSDFIAACISVDGDRWRVFENADLNGSLQRNLADPNAEGDEDFYPSMNGTRHSNSGVPSLAFNLLAEGGLHPRAAEIGRNIRGDL
jgi:vibriolysin